MAKSLQEHLASGNSMARLVAHADRLRLLQTRLEATLPAALRPHARVANFRLGKLSIHANNGAIAAKIRQLGPRIASQLSDRATEITQIGVKVQPLASATPPPPHERPSLPGDEQKRGLARLAQSVPRESGLARALERLLHAIKE